MAGHSKWSQVQQIKEPRGVKRGAAFRKRVKEISVPVRLGDTQHMCADHIERLINIITSKNHGSLAAVGSVPSMDHQLETVNAACRWTVEDRTSALLTV